MKRIMSITILLITLVMLLSGCGGPKCAWCGIYEGVKTLYNGDKVCMYCYNK